MRVIESGNTLEICRCKKCNCLFEYNNYDIKCKESDEYLFGWHYSIIKSITCPECGKTKYLYVDIDGKDLTKEWNK